MITRRQTQRPPTPPTPPTNTAEQNHLFGSRFTESQYHGRAPVTAHFINYILQVKHCSKYSKRIGNGVLLVILCCKIDAMKWTCHYMMQTIIPFRLRFPNLMQNT